ncbi:MAG: sortase [Bacilli bacterium]|nr:sortase [Bacilli bacterium]
MQKRKEKNNKSQLIKVGSFLILLGMSVISINLIINFINIQNEKNLIKEYYENEEYIVDVPVMEEEIVQEEQQVEEKKEDKKVEINYIAVIKIPKIGLEKGLASKDSYYNNVNRNIQILTESDMPDKEKGNVILASHSGNSSVSYFHKLNKLEYNDSVIISYKGRDYVYRMVNSYEIEKNGYAHILRNAEKTTLTLITCKHNSNKQLIVICELIEER